MVIRCYRKHLMDITVEERGFSFLEAMIVMAVAGLLLTAAVPKIADLDRFAVDKEILQMVGDIRYI